MAKRISVYCDDSMVRAFKTACTDRTRKASDLARIVLLDWLRREGYLPPAAKRIH
jgi:hypothetical protein